VSNWKILAVDTALGACSVAVLDGARVLAKRHVAMDRGHAEVLAPMVEETMREASLAFGELARLAVTTGPGTFTGQRVGLAFMRALKVALNIPCLGVTTLAAMAAQACEAGGVEWAIAAHDARRGEFYCGVYTKDGVCLLEPILLNWDDAPAAQVRQARRGGPGAASD
jgi:tRNA threonylcarbamoyladenosine biosynthesis protein TsaB